MCKTAVGRKEEKRKYLSFPFPASLLQVAPLPSALVAVAFIVLQVCLATSCPGYAVSKAAYFLR